MGQILGTGWEVRGQIHFPLYCPSMSSSKGDRTPFAELGGLVMLVPHPLKGLPGITLTWDLVTPVPGGCSCPHRPRMGAVVLAQPLQRVCPCLPPRSVGISPGGRARSSGVPLGQGGCSWHPLSSQMFSLC